MTSIPTIKRGDAATLTLDLGVDLTGYTAARVLIAPYGLPPVVDRAGTIAGSTVVLALTPDDTAAAGAYLVEVEMTPGPHTYPSDRYAVLEIAQDLG